MGRRRLVLLLPLVVLAVPVAVVRAGEHLTAVTELKAASATTPPPAFERLRQRSLRLPRIPPGTCRMKPELSPATANVPGRPGEAALGDGPVYVAFRGIPRLLDAFPARKNGPSRWRVGRTVWISSPSYRGPALVRGARVDGPGRLGFGVTVTPRWELRFPGRNWEERSPTFRRWRGAARQGWRFADALMRIRARGCYAIQIDGLSFSDVIVFGAVLQR